jgi:hypothetical protein
LRRSHPWSLADRGMRYWACDGAINVFSLGKRENHCVTMAPSYLFAWGRRRALDFLKVHRGLTN